MAKVKQDFTGVRQQLDEFLDLSDCTVEEKYDRLIVRIPMPDYDIEFRFSLQHLTIDCRAYFTNDPDLAFNKVYKLWMSHQLAQVAEYHYYQAQNSSRMHEFIDSLVIDIRDEFYQEFKEYRTKLRKEKEANKVV